LDVSITYYVALPFIRTEEGSAAGQGQECPNEHWAIRKAEAMSRDAANVVALAFKRTGDPNIGTYSDATILKTFGLIPEISTSFERLLRRGECVRSRRTSTGTISDGAGRTAFPNFHFEPHAAHYWHRN
jgi:hypothetical protein